MGEGVLVACLYMIGALVLGTSFTSNLISFVHLILLLYDPFPLHNK